MNRMISKRNILGILYLLIFCTGVTFAQIQVIPKGSIWKYLDTGADPGNSWNELNYDDSKWKSGPGQLGYGDDDEATVISYGPDEDNKYAAYYFRHKFTVSDINAYKIWEMKLVRDDGAVVYLNGHEIHRVNMPAGTITYHTFADGEGTDATFFPLTLKDEDYSFLQAGENILAVEVHQGSESSSDLSFDFEFIAYTTPPPPPPLVRKEPYLIYEGNNTEMSLMWQLSRTSLCSVMIGTDETYSIKTIESEEFNADHQHKITFKDLIPGNKYYYKLIAGDDIIKYDFYAAPDTSAEKLKFVVYGDTRSVPEAHDAVASKIVEGFGEGYQSMVISVGDYCDDGGVEECWDTEFFPRSQRNVRKMLGSSCLMGVMGNHENDGDGGILFRKYLAYPFASKFAKYWSINYGPALIIGLDQYASMSKTSTQIKWLEKLLASSTKKWKIAVLHEPGWSTGDHDNNVTVQNILQPLFEKYNVQVVFGGDNHLYARASVNGIKHITTGGGGAPLADPRPQNQNPNVDLFAQTYHYCRIDINGDVLTLTAVDVDGHIIDSFSINSVTAVREDGSDASQPGLYKLYDAYPNPFNPSTTLTFSLPKRSNARLQIFDELGKLVSTALQANLETGVYHYKWNASGLASGVYYYKLTTDEFAQTKKIVLLK